MSTNTGHIMTLANSIIGVSVLAMPFCFKQCGITLAILMLILSSITSRLACHFLMKSSSMCKKRNFEFLAFYTFGPSGKLLVELGIIGFMMGTCVAFFVVIGDLGPQIISKILNVKNDSTLRSLVLLGLGLCVVLPLGLLRNIESLAAISTVTIGFYFLLIIKIFLESFSHLLAGDWIQQVNFWQPEGALQCIPIFAMALSCQTQIFEIYETLPVPTLDKMNSVVRSAINMCTVVYISVGLLGYIAFCTGNFTGNILLSFAPSLASEMYKFGFVMSIAVSFPLVIFPCRASLYSLLFKRMPVHHELNQTSSNIPDLRFKCLTIGIVGVAMVTGLLIPSIELVLGFVGSTIGVAICVIFPALSFINLTNKETNERITAKITFIIGLMIMITGSLANFQAATKVKSSDPSFVKLPDNKIFPEFKLPMKNVISTESAQVVDKKLADLKYIKKKIPEKLVIDRRPSIVKKPILDQKKEPPFPVPPAHEMTPSQKSMIAPPASLNEIKKNVADRNPKEIIDVPINAPKNIKLSEDNINKDAIAKEEREMQEIEHEKKKEEEQKQEELLQKLKEHQNLQEKLLQEQQKILIEMKNLELEKNKNEDAKEKKNKPDKPTRKNVKPIEKNFEKIAENVKDAKMLKVNDKPSESKKNLEFVPDARIRSPISSSPLDSATKSKKASMPLPLAKLQSNSLNNRPLELAAQSKQEVMGRDILQDSQQQSKNIREKRDAKSESYAVVSEECVIVKDKEKAVKNSEIGDTANVEAIIKEKNVPATARSENIIKNLEHISLGVGMKNGLALAEPITRIITKDSKLAIPTKRDLKSIESNKTSLESYRESS